MLEQIREAANGRWTIDKWHVITLSKDGKSVRVQARVNQKGFVHMRKFIISPKEAAIRIQFFRFNTKGELIYSGEDLIRKMVSPEEYSDLSAEILAAFGPAA